MRLRALLTTLVLGAALMAPPLAGAADRHGSRNDHGRRSSYRQHRDDHAYSHRQYRPAPRHYAPRYRYYAPRYHAYVRPYYAPLYPAPAYPYGYASPYAYPYGGVYPYGGYPPYAGYAYPYPLPLRRGVHGAVGLGFPGFGFSVFF
jgi:hypothetical protein